jgi:hypothetical protein
MRHVPAEVTGLTEVETTMEIADAVRTQQQIEDASADVPVDAKIVILVLNDHQHPAAANRREHARCAYQVPAMLGSVKGEGAQRKRIYTRDVNAWGVGFVTQEMVPVGSEAFLLMSKGFGQVVQRKCTIVRCREAMPGWYEGAVRFHAEEPALAPDAIGKTA